MKNIFIHISFKTVFSVLLFLLFFVSEVRSQDKNDKSVDSTHVGIRSISISDISDESEKLSQRIIRLRKILKPSTEISKVDSLLSTISKEVKHKKDSLLQDLKHLSSRVLKVNKAEWNNYHNLLKKYQEVLKDRSEEISEVSNELTKEVERWEETQVILEKNEASSDVYNGLDKIIASLKEVRKIALTRLDDIFIKQKKLTELVLTIDDTILEIDLAEQQLKKNYFVFDSKPIWISTDIGFAEIDSTGTTKAKVVAGPVDQIIIKLKENENQLKEFIRINSNVVIFQVAFLISLFIVFFRLNINWEKRAKKKLTPIEKQTKTILSSPISAAVVSGIMISAFFFESIIPPYVEILIILVLLGTIFLLPKITTKSFRIPLILILLSYLIQVTETYLGYKNSSLRVFMIIDALILISALVVGKRIISGSEREFRPVYRIFILLSPVFILILVVAVITNVIGMVNLSRFLIYGILNSTALGMVVFLSVRIVTSIVVLFFRFRKKFSIQALSAMLDVTNKRIKPLLNLIGLIVWLMFTLKGFDLYDVLVEKINDIMAIHWDVGEMTVSLGGILSFLGIFIIALLLSKLASAIFQDEWMVNVLPRGVAPAVSLLMRIFLIGIGLYMALSAAGLDVSKLGFMVGALGVGIGFGLQNVVLNFVAGLILAFERPINLGDTIEVDQEFGVVTSIGVRSSNIKSYSGYEAIVPNGDLISKKVINYTLTDRNRRSKIIMKTAPDAEPEKVIDLLSEMAREHPATLDDPEPKTYFYGYDPDGNLSFTLLYWTTFSDTLKTDSEIALKIFAKLKEEGIQAPAPVRRILKEK